MPLVIAGQVRCRSPRTAGLLAVAGGAVITAFTVGLLLLAVLAWGPVPTGFELRLGSHSIMRESDLGFGSDNPTFYTETMMLYSGEHTGMVCLFQIDRRAYVLW